MPHKENMIEHKKGIIVEVLMRVIVAAVVLWAVFNIGKDVAEAFFGGNAATQSFENFVDEINNMDLQSKQTIIYLDPGTAIIGFGRNKQEFRCYGCDQEKYSESLVHYSVKKPSNEQCNDKSCVCICMNGLSKSLYSGDESVISCKLFSCKTLKNDIPMKISLEKALRDKGMSRGVYPYWDNGFFFVRVKDMENGMIQKDDAGKVTLFIEKKQISNDIFAAACPSLPCIQ